MIRLLAFLLLLPAFAHASEEVVAGLSHSEISITANFDGSDILIYGAVKREEPIPGGPPLEVIVTVEGPSTPIMVRRKSRTFGIWVNTAGVEVDRAPSFYAVATTGPLNEILSQTEDLRQKISVPQMIRSVGAPQEIADSPAFTEALIRIREGNGLYSLKEGSVALEEATLFRTDIDLPANLVEGNYLTRIFLLRDKLVIAKHEAFIDVRKVGLERWLYDLANGQPMIYGILALVLAALAGWLASTAFRLLRNG
ncbi:TIGR02186 family protein [Defluviimonas sp. SAOS-178_SWC]|uniref:TIGR02186 family protein n=1 Tax=Defluviimonas sp. SAOS-178_SWC TaxID=3121287 RepID=UPI003221B7D6